jgi:dsRNA-specific ribonuclease
MKKLPAFKNQAFFDQAFTHRSYLNEAKEKLVSNERLEFLGDSILSFVVSDYLYKPILNLMKGSSRIYAHSSSIREVSHKVQKSWNLENTSSFLMAKKNQKVVRMTHCLPIHLRQLSEHYI